MMIEHMFRENGIQLDADIEKHKSALELINSLITGDKEAWKRLLKPAERFLTEIVSNKYCNIDVDKVDYLLRDSFHCDKEIEPFKDFLNRARVVNDSDGVSHVCYHTDDFKLIEIMFKNRAKYHREVYQLPEVAGIDQLLLDIFFLADDAGFKINGYLLSEIQEHPSAFIDLNDSVLDLIRESPMENAKMTEAKKLIKKLDTGKFYHFIMESSDESLVTLLYEKLEEKFGEIFCKKTRKIPDALISEKIPLYNEINYDCIINKKSDCDLQFCKTMIFCKSESSTDIDNVMNFINNYNNNF
jgi:HD superfamily phosphohydrolase